MRRVASTRGEKRAKLLREPRTPTAARKLNPELVKARRRCSTIAKSSYQRLTTSTCLSSILDGGAGARVAVFEAVAVVL